MTILIFCSKKDSNYISCDRALEMATNDFKYGKFTYYSFQFLTNDTIANKEFKNLLNQNNITAKFKTRYPLSCIPEEKNGVDYD